MINDQIRATLETLPHKPGIYIYKDEQGKVMYVGKATSLHQRVRSYFQEGADLSPKNRSLVLHIHDIEYIVVANPIEALILENEYIKRHQPKYNVRLRDDKTYPYIKISLNERFPRVYRVRSFHHDGNRYFGPYTNVGAIDATLDLLNKIFPFRTCRYDDSQWTPPATGKTPTDWKQKLLSRPCTQYYIHRCQAPCVAHVTPTEYSAMIHQVILFLEGKQETILTELQAAMDLAAEDLDFERAALLRDRIQAVAQILEKQKIVNTARTDDRDVIAIAQGDDETSAQIFFFRSGKLAGRESFMLKGTRDVPPSEIIASFMQQFYAFASAVPGEILVQHEPDDLAALSAWLTERRDGKVTITQPKRGDNVRLVEMVANNAKETLELERIRWLTDSQKTALAMQELQTALHLPKLPHRIECYDISSIQGTAIVGSMVIFEHGKPKNADYRRFKIKTVQGSDDYASHQEMLRRRFKRLLNQPADQKQASTNEEEVDSDMLAGQEHNDDSFQILPDLIIIDGGKGHLHADMAVLQELGIVVPIVGIAKEDHSATSQHEEIYLTDENDPIVLPRGSQGLYLIQRIRDEAHRFAITYHRQVRSKKTFASILDEVPGIGPKRKKALIKHFGSVKGIAAATLEEVMAVDGITRDVAERVKEYLGHRETILPVSP